MSNSLFRTKKISTILSEGSDDTHGTGGGLKRVLTVRDLTFFGIAAILGAGSFSSLGGAVFNGGPGVVILFIMTAIACAFTAFCYSEFASRIPVAGSAYTYAYASFGELFAWIIGWALIMEYSIGNIYVAFSWSDYFTSFLDKVGVHIPHWLSTSYSEAKNAVASSGNADDINAWNTAPMLGSLRLIFDLPALVINMLITYLVYRGIKESRNFSNVMVVLKMAVVVLVILVGGYFVFSNGLTFNWTPANDEGVKSFMPNGFGGVMAAVAGVFFAYIGFDAVSVLAEESKNPQRDLPKGMIYSLVICTVVYILLTLVLSGAVHYKNFDGVGDPLSFIFEKQNLNVGWMQFLVSICAVVAMTSVLLVFQMGQPRIWMSMSRDGLLPPVFQKIHPKFKTPSFATIITGVVVGLPILFTDKTFVLDFTSIATLFAFVLVCGGVLLIPRKEKTEGRFNLPYINSKFIFPLIVAGTITLLAIFSPNYFISLFNFSGEDVNLTFNISAIIFWLACIILSAFAFIKNWSLIPLLGLTTCMYLLTGMTAANWAWFMGWLAIGLLVYFMYGYKKSKLANATSESNVVKKNETGPDYLNKFED
jgi:basic amino acid/polyamine antiporter, APA family